MRLSFAARLGVILLIGCGPRRGPAAGTTADSPSASAGGVDTTSPAMTPAPADTPPGPAPAPAPPPKPKRRSPPTPAATAPTDAAQPPHDRWHPAPRDTLDSDTYQGWKQFELNCSRCHGEYAVGTSFAPALVVSLKDGGTIPTKEVFITTVCAGRPEKVMPSWCTLGLEMSKIEQIYRYVKARADDKIAIGRPALKE